MEKLHFLPRVFCSKCNSITSHIPSENGFKCSYCKTEILYSKNTSKTQEKFSDKLLKEVFNPPFTYHVTGEILEKVSVEDIEQGIYVTTGQLIHIVADILKWIDQQEENKKI